jgi:hypothetical protein
MVTKSLSSVGLAFGILCLAIGGTEWPSSDNSGALIVAGAIIIGASLIALAIDGRRLV